jgi:hypothetical protein
MSHQKISEIIKHSSNFLDKVKNGNFLEQNFYNFPSCFPIIFLMNHHGFFRAVTARLVIKKLFSTSSDFQPFFGNFLVRLWSVICNYIFVNVECCFHSEKRCFLQFALLILEDFNFIGSIYGGMLLRVW